MTAVWAHRGGRGPYPENSLEAFIDARRLGAEGVELDVRRSADGALVVQHDPEVPGRGPVSDLTVDQLPPHVPLLAAALDAVHDLVVNVEVKHEPGDDLTVATAAAAAVVEAGVADRVVVSSFSGEALRAVRETGTELPLGWLMGVGATVTADPGLLVDQAVERGYAALHPFVLGLTRDFVERAHDAGLRVNVWTVNAEADLRRCAELQVDAVITDLVAEALKVLAGLDPATGGVP